MHMHDPERMHEDRTAFFDRIAGAWDARVASAAFLARVETAVDGLSVAYAAPILDLGCGTGNLTRILAHRAPDTARIIAVDFSKNMLDAARAKLPDDDRITWLQADAAAIPVPSGTVATAICFSAWPHFPRPADVATELHRLLRAGGLLHVLHVDGRDTINRIHHHAGGAVAHDMLPPATELGSMLEAAGFRLVQAVDEADRYLVTARRD